MITVKTTQYEHQGFVLELSHDHELIKLWVDSHGKAYCSTPNGAGYHPKNIQLWIQQTLNAWTDD